MSEKIIELAKKLKALAHKGEGGEKENAQQKLAALMKKHGITPDQIEEDVIENFSIEVKVKNQRFFMQVVCSVCDAKVFGYKGKRNYLILECTASEFVEIESKFEFYLKEYEKELKQREEIFYRAFVQKNALYLHTGEKQEKKDLTPEELEEIQKILKVADDIQASEYRKQLKG